MNKFRVLILNIFFIFLIFFISNLAHAEERFPLPEFTSGYKILHLSYPLGKTETLAYMDTIVLTIMLLLASFLALKKRSRNGLFLLSIFSIFYFGFYRKGCVCSIGAIQNVALSLGDNGYIIPLTITLFFLLPLIFSSFYGRVFCSSVCPLGALQEVVIYRPIKLPQLLTSLLGIIPYLYLGVAVLFAFTNTGFIICKFDPFIGIYRLSGSILTILLGIIFLVIGVFIARPYCRFFCPYGVLLGIFSYFSKRHLCITPDKCVKCRLCQDSCPVNAIRKPFTKTHKINKEYGIKKLRVYFLIFPVIVFLFGWGFSGMSKMVARYNYSVRLEEKIKIEDSLQAKGTLESIAFNESGESLENLSNKVTHIQRQFKMGMWIFGLFIGVVFMLKVINRARLSIREDYEPDRFHCLSCGRCMEYCPVTLPKKEK